MLDVKSQKQDDAEMLYDSSKTVPDSEKEAAIEKNRTLLNTYRVESNAIEGGMRKAWRVHHIRWNVSLAMKQSKGALFKREIDES